MPLVRSGPEKLGCHLPCIFVGTAHEDECEQHFTERVKIIRSANNKDRSERACDDDE